MSELAGFLVLLAIKHISIKLSNIISKIQFMFTRKFFVTLEVTVFGLISDILNPFRLEL